MKRVGTEKGRKTSDEPIPKGGMVRYKDKLVPRLSRDTEMSAPIRKMRDKGKGEGLEVEPEFRQLTADEHEAGWMNEESARAKTKKYASGGKVRGCGAATKGLTKGTMR